MFPRDFPGPESLQILCYTSAGGSGLIPGWGTKIPHAAWSGQNNKILKKKISPALLQKQFSQSEGLGVPHWGWRNLVIHQGCGTVLKQCLFLSGRRKSSPISPSDLAMWLRGPFPKEGLYMAVLLNVEGATLIAMKSVLDCHFLFSLHYDAGKIR